MDNDFNQKNNKLYIICMICLVLSLCLTAFAIYIFPVIFWNIRYDIPEFVGSLQGWFVDNYNFQANSANWIVILLFLVPGILAGIATQVITRMIENSESEQMVEKPQSSAPVSDSSGDSLGFALKVLFLVLLVIAAVFFSEWFFSATL